jgi:fumarate reductase subunit D
MREMHVWNLLALHVPNALPRSVPWIELHNWHFKVVHSQWPRHAGRLIWASLLLLVGLVIAFVLVRRPKTSTEPATWAQSIVGALLVWVMMVLAYGTIPHEWLNFGNAYLNFNKATFVARHDQLASHIPPFDITRAVIVDGVAALMYVVFIGVQIYLFSAWQKRKVAEPAAVAVAEGDGEVPPPPSGPFARFRRRREVRVSAYGRPVTTSE